MTPEMVDSIVSGVCWLAFIVCFFGPALVGAWRERGGQ
jgi:hypothetical protein